MKNLKVFGMFAVLALSSGLAFASMHKDDQKIKVVENKQPRAFDMGFEAPHAYVVVKNFDAPMIMIPERIDVSVEVAKPVTLASMRLNNKSLQEYYKRDIHA